MSKDILLSICIPTYNQPFEAKRLLKEIYAQITDEVEVVIGDDSTNSETKEMIKKNFPTSQIRYHKNEHKETIRNTSLNFDKNILGITERAQGKYAWWFGDDEMELGAIDHILKAIKEYPEISLILVNHHVAGQKPALNLGKDKFLKDGNQALRETTNLLDFASSIVFKKEAISNVNYQVRESFIGSGFINLFLVMHILSGQGRFFYVNQSYVCMHPTPPGKASYNGFQVFAINYYKIVMNFRDKFDRKFLKEMLAKNFGHVWRGILVGWLRGYDTPKGKLRPMFKFYWNFPEFWLAAPLFMMPKIVTKFVYFIYKKVLKRTYNS